MSPRASMQRLSAIRSLLFNGFAGDLRCALRGLKRNPGFTTASIVTLSIGIGAQTAIFSVMDSVLLRPLPYKDADQFVQLAEQVSPESGVPGNVRLVGFSRSELDELRARVSTLSHLGTYLPASVTMMHAGEATRISGIRVSPDVFEMLGRAPLFGRLFEGREEASGLDRTIILSHGLWQRHFAGDAEIIGRRLSIDGADYEIVGVMPPDFQFPDSAAQFWIPFAWPSGAKLVVTGRVRDGASIASVNADVTRVLRFLRMDNCSRALSLGLPPPPPPPPPPGVKGPRVKAPPCGSDGDTRKSAREQTQRFQVIRLKDRVIAPVKEALLVLTIAVWFLLMIACANVANLMLARGTARVREIRLRTALGATPARIVRQLLTESSLLASAGCIAGAAIAWNALQALRILGAALPRHDLRPSFGMPRLEEIALHPAPLISAIAISAVATIAFALLPAVHQSGESPANFLREGAGVAYSGLDIRRPSRVRGVLIALQVGIAMLLFVASALLIRSFLNLLHVDPGYDPHGVLTFQIAVPRDRAAFAFAEDLTARLRSLPGIVATGYADSLPFTIGSGTIPLRTSPGTPQNGPPPPPAPSGATPPEFPQLRIVTSGFLHAMGIHIVQGSGFDDRGGWRSMHRVLVNQTLARSGVLGPDPVGKLVYAGSAASSQVAGIVADVRQIGVDVDPGPQVFAEYTSLATADAVAVASPPYFAVRTEGDPAAIVNSIRGLVRNIDPRATLDNVATMDELVSNSLVRPRLYAVIAGALAAIAVSLVAVGIYGAIAFAVVQRTREIGIRVAVGAGRCQIMALVWREVALLTATGLAGGAVAAAIFARYLRGMLFGIGPLDSSTFGAVTVFFAGVATVAALVPAHRATKIDPVLALRCE